MRQVCLCWQVAATVTVIGVGTASASAVKSRPSLLPVTRERAARSHPSGHINFWGLTALFLWLGLVPSRLRARRDELSLAGAVQALGTYLQRFNEGQCTFEEVAQAMASTLVNELGVAMAAIVRRLKESWRLVGCVPSLTPNETEGDVQHDLPDPCPFEDVRDWQMWSDEALWKRLADWPSLGNLAQRSGCRAGCWASLRWRGHLLGGLFVGVSRPTLNKDDLEALEFLRHQVTALMALASPQETHQRDHALQTQLQWRLVQLAKQLGDLEGLEAKVWAVLKEAWEALGLTRVRFWRLDTATGRWRCVLVLGATEKEDGMPKVRDPEQFARYLAALEDARCLVVTDVRGDDRVQELWAEWRDPVTAFAAVPVRLDDRIVAVLECECNEALRSWRPEEVAFLSDLADLLARLWLEDRWQKRERCLETLAHIALQLLVVTDWTGAMPAVLSELGTVLKVDIAALMSISEDEHNAGAVRLLCEWTPEAICSHLADQVQTVWEALAPSVKSDLQSGRAVSVTVSLFPQPQRETLQRLQAQSLLLLPVFVESHLWGILAFVQSRYERFWSDADIAVLRVAASLIGSAVERQAATERQLEQERQFRDLFENAVIGIYRSTPDGYFLMANQTLAHINGYQSVAELMALDIPTQIYANPEDRERFKRLMEEQGFVADFRYPIKRKDGSIGWVAKWARAVRDKNGEVLYYEGFVLDITEQMLLAQRLQGLQDIAHLLVTRLDLDSLLQVSVQELTRLYPDAMVLVLRHLPEERGYLISAANAAGRQWLQAIGRDIGAIMPERPLHPLEQRLRRGEAVIGDVVSDFLSTPSALDGQQFRAAFLRGLGTLSEFWGALAVVRVGDTFASHDLTFLNSFCDYLSIAVRNAVLFQQVQQAYDELRAMQERAMEQERLRALGQMASGIAHDINNALVPIQGFAELLLDHDDPTVQSAAQVIFKAARDITAIVQRMREFYRPRTGDELQEPLDLNALCQDALTMTRPRWHNIPQERGVVIETRLELANDLPPVMGISNEVRQALINLILNAADAMPNGGVLTLRTYRVERGGRTWAVVEVCDTGVGMDEETRRRAVEPFFTTKGEGGSGLGLSVVYGTMQRHDGLLEIDSALGRGTTVRLWFPSKTATVETGAPGELPPLRLLVIDDEPSVREMLASLLRRDGHWVITAPDGEQGLMAFRAALEQGTPFNAVITDLGMPRMDGLSVARAVKTLSAHTPVILLSGWGFRLRAEETDCAVDAVLTKPATHQQLRRALVKVCQRGNCDNGAVVDPIPVN